MSQVLPVKNKGVLSASLVRVDVVVVMVVVVLVGAGVGTALRSPFSSLNRMQPSIVLHTEYTGEAATSALYSVYVSQAFCRNTFATFAANPPLSSRFTGDLPVIMAYLKDYEELSE